MKFGRFQLLCMNVHLSVHLSNYKRSRRHKSFMCRKNRRLLCQRQISEFNVYFHIFLITILILILLQRSTLKYNCYSFVNYLFNLIAFTQFHSPSSHLINQCPCMNYCNKTIFKVTMSAITHASTYTYIYIA